MTDEVTKAITQMYAFMESIDRIVNHAFDVAEATDLSHERLARALSKALDKYAENTGHDRGWVAKKAEYAIRRRLWTPFESYNLREGWEYDHRGE